MLRPHPGVELQLLALPGMPVRRPTGSRIAITGPSGAGKTTLVEALIGLRPPPPDAIVRIGGRDIATLSADIVRSTFAWAPQDAQSRRNPPVAAAVGLPQLAQKRWRACQDSSDFAWASMPSSSGGTTP